MIAEDALVGDSPDSKEKESAGAGHHGRYRRDTSSTEVARRSESHAHLA
jgi:hypothetical protein